MGLYLNCSDIILKQMRTQSLGDNSEKRIMRPRERKSLNIFEKSYTFPLLYDSTLLLSIVTNCFVSHFKSKDTILSGRAAMVEYGLSESHKKNLKLTFGVSSNSKSFKSGEINLKLFSGLFPVKLCSSTLSIRIIMLLYSVFFNNSIILKKLSLWLCCSFLSISMLDKSISRPLLFEICLITFTIGSLKLFHKSIA